MKGTPYFIFAAILVVANVGASFAGTKDGIEGPGPEAPPPPAVEVPRISSDVMIDFDEATQPCWFIEADLLHAEYAALGVVFSGPTAQNGGAVLDECGIFGVSGYSSPNFLAFNCDATLLGGGTPTGPETMTFDPPVSFVEALVGSSSDAGSVLSVDAFDADGNLVDSSSLVMHSTMHAISVSAPSIKTVVFGNTQPCVWVLDDLAYEANGAKGDVIPDGEVNSADAIRTLFFAMEIIIPTPEEFYAADMNSDGLIDAGDAVLVLQTAVGSSSATTEGLSARLDMRLGSEVGEVALLLQAVAGLEITITYDPTSVRYVDASVTDGEGVVVGREMSAGTLRFGVVKANAEAAEVRIQFDLDDPYAVVRLEDVRAFDGMGSEQSIDVGTTELSFGVTAVTDRPVATRPVEWLGGTPNPFNPTTQLTFRLDAAGDAVLRIYSSAGRQVREFPLVDLAAGEHRVFWDGTDAWGARVSSGSYLVHVHANGSSDVGRVTLVR